MKLTKKEKKEKAALTNPSATSAPRIPKYTESWI